MFTPAERSGVLDGFPMTTDLTQWYATTGLFGIAALLALSAWAFRTSLGGRPCSRT